MTSSIVMTDSSTEMPLQAVTQSPERPARPSPPRFAVLQPENGGAQRIRKARQLFLEVLHVRAQRPFPLARACKLVPGIDRLPQPFLGDLARIEFFPIQPLLLEQGALV